MSAESLRAYSEGFLAWSQSSVSHQVAQIVTGVGVPSTLGTSQRDHMRQEPVAGAAPYLQGNVVSDWINITSAVAMLTLKDIV